MKRFPVSRYRKSAMFFWDRLVEHYQGKPQLMGEELMVMAIRDLAKKEAEEIGKVCGAVEPNTASG